MDNNNPELHKIIMIMPVQVQVITIITLMIHKIVKKHKKIQKIRPKTRILRHILSSKVKNLVITIK